MSMVKRAILGAVGDHLLSRGTVVSVAAVGPHLRAIELRAESLVNATWRPGDKLQLNTGDWALRTYTPTALDPRTGTLELLAYARDATTPAARWLQRVKVGDGCQFRGPSRSVEVSEPTLLFGDETSLGLAISLGERVACVLEVGPGIEAAVRELGLREARLIERRPDFAHLDAVMRAMAELGRSRVLLTGHAQTIQRLRGRLRPRRMQAKAYWSTGKCGLD